MKTDSKIGNEIIRQLELEGQAKKEFIEDIKKDFIRAANSLLDAKN